MKANSTAHCSEVLCGPMQYGLDVHGVFTAHFLSSGKMSTGDVYLVKGLNEDEPPIIIVVQLVEKLCSADLKMSRDTFPRVGMTIQR